MEKLPFKLIVQKEFTAEKVINDILWILFG